MRGCEIDKLNQLEDLLTTSTTALVVAEKPVTELDISTLVAMYADRTFALTKLDW